MAPKILFFPVDNGDMTLIELESGRTILIDTNIRESADNPSDETPDVASMLRDRLKRDAEGRLYVDVFILSHPDQDHCRGAAKHLHLGAPQDYDFAEDKIFVREMWSSPMVFRRASKTLTLCDDAKAINTEAKRRVNYFRDNLWVDEGNRIKILGEDENGKTDDLGPILVKVDTLVSSINGSLDPSLMARLLGPLPASDIGEEEILSKNDSSVIIQFSLSCRGTSNACLFLTGGDAEVAIWERLWEKHHSNGWLDYHVLQAPHHCSWHSLSWDSWSRSEEPQTSSFAVNALSQARQGALIVASCKPILDDDSDPPCFGAKVVYNSIVTDVSGKFLCTGEYPDSRSPKIMEIEITQYGPLEPRRQSGASVSRGAIGRQPLSHG